MPNLLDVLRATRDGGPGHLRCQDLDERQLRWAVETGLGPLLRELAPEGSPLTRSPAWPLVVGADLAARVESAEQLDAAAGILDAVQGIPPVLLKGISLCEEVYPRPHLRPMRDLDLLVGRDALADVESVLSRLGYERDAPPEAYRAHHHSAPFVHPRTKVWVEVHHRLFPPASALGADPLFAEEAVAAEVRDSTWRGRPVRRLTAEMQVVYLSAHWSSSAKLLRGPGGLLPLLDLMYLLAAREVRWPVIVGWLEGSAAAPGVYALLAYAARRGLIPVPADVLDGLRRRQRAFNALTRTVAFGLVDRCMVAGRPPRYGQTPLLALWKGLFLAGPPLKNLARLPSLLRAARAPGLG